MRLTPESVAAERAWVRDRAPVVVPLINETRGVLEELFATEVDRVAPDEYRAEVDAVFADGDRAVNVAAYVGLLRDLDVAGDYPGFIVDEVLGRELAGTVAGGQPLALLAEATFHVADVHTHGETGGDASAGGHDPAGEADPAGADDLDAALAAGFQTRLPGWEWRESPSPFAVGPDDRDG